MDDLDNAIRKATKEELKGLNGRAERNARIRLLIEFANTIPGHDEYSQVRALIARSLMDLLGEAMDEPTP